MKLIEGIKRLLGSDMSFGNVKINGKTGAILSGTLAQGLIFVGAMNIFERPLYSIFQILYGFLVLLPVAYYQNKRYEEKEVSR